MQNIDSDLIRGNIDTIILKTMLSGDMYGLDIIKEVENKSSGTYELKQPTLYSCLKRLENQELISSYWKESDIGGKRHYYKLTEKGHAELSKKQEEWSKSKFIIDNLLGDFDSDDYRLVKKNDYDKIIEGKKFEYEEDEPAPAESNQSNAAMANVVYVEKEEPTIESETIHEDEPFYVDQNASEQLSINLGANYNEDADKFKSQENNILYNLRSHSAEEINEYYGDKQSYAKQLVIEEPKLEEPQETEEETEPQEAESLEEEPKEYVQQNLLDLGTLDETQDIDESIDEFEENIERLKNFSSTSGDGYEDIGYDDDEAYSFKPDDEADEDENQETDDFSISYESEKSEDDAESFAETSDEDFLGELSELGTNGYQNDYRASADENDDVKIITYTPMQSENLEAKTSYELENENTYEEPEAEETESFEPSPIEHIESDEELWNTWNKDTTDDSFAFTNYPNESSYQTSFEDVISSEKKESFEPAFNSFVPVKDYKKKLENLETYAKSSNEKSDGLSKAKDINSLKNEFEKEGIKVTEFKKEEVSDSEKNYLLINKLNIIKSFILLFGYVFVLSALYMILSATNFKNTTGFSFICFLYGFIPFAIYAIYSTIMYLLSPFKKVPAKYAAGIMFFISAIITVQLLLITYCVNLQMGFYSFSQAGYNHLNWIVPLVISFAPLISTGIHCALFYSRNFNV